MCKSLSLDIREQVVLLVEDGMSCREAARRLRISAASAVPFMQRKEAGWRRASGPPRHSKLDAVSAWLKAHVKAEPDITMPELADALMAAHGVHAAPSYPSPCLHM